MATPFKGVSVGSWNKHLKPYGKRTFWKKVRRFFKKEKNQEKHV